MKLDRLNPFIRYARVHEYYEAKDNDSVCYDCRFFYIVRGEGRLVANKNEYTVSANSAIFLPPETQYRFNFDDDRVYIHVLNFDLCDSFSHLERSLGTATVGEINQDKILRYEPPEQFSQVLVETAEPSLREAIERCTDAFLRREAYYREISSASLKLALIGLLREGSFAQKDLAHSVCLYIKDNYFRHDLSNKTLAAAFGYHPYHLSRVVKGSTGKTLHEYLTDYRIDMAKNYLAASLISITEVAERVGFSSYTYFIKTFRERTGISPLKYRRSKKNIGF